MNLLDAQFERISKYKDDETIILPHRKTKASAGYDFYVAEDTVVPSYVGWTLTKFENEIVKDLRNAYDNFEDATKNMPYDLSMTADIIKQYKRKITLVPTGVKAKMPEDYYLQLSVRSSLSLKHWLVLGNGVGIIDADYYNNPDNEGHIYFQLINLLPFDILLKKGDCIGQGIFIPYGIVNDDKAEATRTGGFGSTNANPGT